MAVPSQKRRCCAIEAFWLKIALPDSPVNSDNNSIGVLSPIKPGKHFSLHSRKGTWAHFLAFCRAGPVLNMAAQFGNALKYTAKSVEKGGVEAPRSLTLSTPILLLSLFSGQSGKPIFTQNRSIAQQRLFLKHAIFHGCRSFFNNSTKQKVRN
jgi:hypothetical protein